jgi:hypothetical protein
LICEFWPLGLDRNGSSAADLIDIISSTAFEPFLIGETALTKTDWPALRALSVGDCAPETQHHADFVAFRAGSEMLSLVKDMIE